MNNYLEQIRNFIPTCEQEESDKRIILNLIEQLGDKILFRETEFAHMSSSALVVNKDLTKVLMIYHNIYKSWSWTGGHNDGNGDVFEVAKREVQEETGVKNIIPISDNIISLEILPVASHHKKEKYISSHLHLNVTYTFIASEDEMVRIKEDENSAVMWIKIDELEKYCTEKMMIPIYKKIINSSKKYF